MEGVNGKLRDELLGAEVFSTLASTRMPIEQWRCTTTRCNRIPRYATGLLRLMLPTIPGPIGSAAPRPWSPPFELPCGQRGSFGHPGPLRRGCHEADAMA